MFCKINEINNVLQIKCLCKINMFEKSLFLTYINQVVKFVLAKLTKLVLQMF